MFMTHDQQSAPEASRVLLEKVADDYQFVPNLYGILAESPACLGGLMSLAEHVSRTTLTPTEQQVVYLAVSYENECSYCVSGHTGVSHMLGIAEHIPASIREGEPIAEPKLNTLSEFSKKVLRSKGWVNRSDLDMFFDAGYSKANALDVVLIIAQKVLSNYAGHLTGVEVDEPFMPFKWTA